MRAGDYIDSKDSGLRKVLEENFEEAGITRDRIIEV